VEIGRLRRIGRVLEILRLDLGEVEAGESSVPVRLLSPIVRPVMVLDCRFAPLNDIPTRLTSLRLQFCILALSRIAPTSITVERSRPERSAEVRFADDRSQAREPRALQDRPGEVGSTQLRTPEIRVPEARPDEVRVW